MGDDLFEIPGVDELYEEEPSQFTKRRNALVKALKREGRKAEAQAVKALSRPTVVAHALNQLARREPDVVHELVEVARAMRDAQASAVSGGDPAALRDLMRRRRAAVRQATTAAVQLVGEKREERVAAALRAATADPDVAMRVVDGRLATEPTPEPGFGLGDMPAPTKQASRRRPRRREVRHLRRAVKEAARRRRAAAQELRDRRRELAAAQQRAQEAEEALDAAEAAHERAAAALADAER